ncbi:unnamed protein product, partial [Closterium sp. NIES-53]
YSYQVGAVRCGAARCSAVLFPHHRHPAAGAHPGVQGLRAQHQHRQHHLSHCHPASPCLSLSLLCLSPASPPPQTHASVSCSHCPHACSSNGRHSSWACPSCSHRSSTCLNPMCLFALPIPISMPIPMPAVPMEGVRHGHVLLPLPLHRAPAGTHPLLSPPPPLFPPRL